MQRVYFITFTTLAVDLSREEFKSAEDACARGACMAVERRCKTLVYRVEDSKFTFIQAFPSPPHAYR
jgi:hypothetical protein